MSTGSLTRAMLVSLASVALVAPDATAVAQTPTGTISGHVTDSAGLAAPAVSVTVQSPVLQSNRTTQTSQNGDYIFRLLPPGQYTVVFQLRGFAVVKETRDVAPTETVELNITLKPAAVTEELTVTPEVGGFTTTVQAGTTYKQDLLSILPTARTLVSAVLFSPEVHTTGPSGNFSIAGAMSFESVYMLNGVQIQDNLRGTPLNLFIEDAIQETTTNTSGISAEYGRFTGGIVNAVTKSGGNEYSGSFRETFTNDNWRTVSPFKEPKTNKVVPTSEFTIGGRVLRDKTWFFGAGRLFDQSIANETGHTKISYVAETNERRFEGKVTHALNGQHRIQAAYTDIQRHEVNNAFPNPATIMDLASLVTRDLPQNLVSVHYSGLLSKNLFVEGQFSARHLSFERSGGTHTDLINGTLLLDQQTGATWWAPAFCGVCATEKRDNQDIVVKGSYFWSTPRGAHNIVFGYDGFNDQRLNDNHQSGSDYHVWATTSAIVGDTVYPVIAGGNARSTWIIHWPIAQASKGTDFRTNSLFVNDSWQYNKHLTMNLGLRWDGNHGKDAAGNTVSNDDALSPRLGVAFDPKGDGHWIVTASYGRYVAALANNIADSASPAGTPSIFAYFYQGPSINTSGTPTVPSDQALQRVFDWFFANGGTNRSPFFVSVPGLTPQIRGSLKSPHADEFTVGVTHQFGPRAAVRADFISRVFKDFYTDRIDTSTGVVADEFGQEFDLDLITNTNAVERTYKALAVQGSYRPFARMQFGGSYTLSELRGNINGENVTSGPITSGVLAYPEYADPAWNNPIGDLAADQRHRARIWANIELLNRARLGRFSAGVVQVAESGTPYGAVGSIDTTGFVSNPGYITPAVPVSYYFTARDAFRTKGQRRTDLAINYSHRVPGAMRGELFAQMQVLNLFNQFQVFNLTTNVINTTVRTAFDDDTKYRVFNPFTETPAQGVNWDYDRDDSGNSKFGTATSATAYTVPRTFLLSIGVRF